MRGEDVRIGVLASGSGTNLEAILAAGLPVAVVVVDRPCRATEIAAEHGVPSELVPWGGRAGLRGPNAGHRDRVEFTHAVVDALKNHGVDVVAMAGFMVILEKPIFDAYRPDLVISAGFMKLVGSEFLERFGGRMINTHPALLPAFPGMHGPRDALAYGVKVTGVTIHVATLEVDSGPILAQEAVPVLPGDTAETLHERIKVVERRLYPDTIREFIA